MRWVRAIKDSSERGIPRLCLLADGTYAVLSYIGNYEWEPAIPYDDGYLIFNTLSIVTHWMELPDPPRPAS
jgi:uncharacterized protein DUF551